VDLQRMKKSAPWLAVFLFLFLPMYTITAAVVIRSGVFDFNGKPLNADQYKAFWAFIAAALGSAATVLGLLFTRSHNQRTLAFQEDIENRKLLAETEANERNAALQEDAAARLSLDTVVKSLELITTNDGQYAPKAKLAGALAALVHLGHPIIAMRTLGSLWEDDKVDAGTAAWLISEVFREGTEGGLEAAMMEASELLRRNVAKLSDGQSQGGYEWPEIIWGAWPQHIPINARMNNLVSIVGLLLSEKRDWWEGGTGYGWFIVILDEIRRTDSTEIIRTSAADMLRPLSRNYPRPDAFWAWQGETRTLKAIRADLDSYPPGTQILAAARQFIPRIEAWVAGQKQDVHAMEDSGVINTGELPK
jgi:hypothetical protein